MNTIKLTLRNLLNFFVISLPFIALGINVGADTIPLSFIALTLMVAFMFFKSIPFTLSFDKPSLSLYAFFIFACFSVFYSLNQLNLQGSVMYDAPAAKGIKQLMMLLIVIFHFVFLNKIFQKQKPEDSRKLIRLFIITCFFVSLYSFYQFVAQQFDLPFQDMLRNTQSYSVMKINETSGWMGGGLKRTKAFMPESSFWGAFLLIPISLILPMAASRSNLKMAALLGTFFLAEFLSFSRTGWFCLLAILVYFLFCKAIYERKYRGILIMSVLSFFLFLMAINIIYPDIVNIALSFGDYSSDVRFSFQRAAFFAFLDNWLTGVGWGNTGFVIDQITTYNFFLQILLETGVIGLLIFGSFLFKLWSTLSMIQKHMLQNPGNGDTDLILGLKMAMLSIILVWFTSTAYNCSYIWFVFSFAFATAVTYNKRIKSNGLS